MSKIFVSYSRRDQDYARRLAEDIRAHGLDCWIDDRIEHGDNWFVQIETAIRTSAAFVVIMTPASEQSEWVRKEILIAKREQKPIFPVLLEGREFALLIDTQYADVTGGRLPPPNFYERLNRAVMDAFDPFATGFMRKPKPPAPAPAYTSPPATPPARKPKPEAPAGGRRSWVTCAIIAVIVGVIGVCGLVGLSLTGELATLLDEAGVNNASVLGSGSGGGSGWQNAEAFLNALNETTLVTANQYVCPENRGFLAEAIASGLAQTGVWSLSNIACSDNGDGTVGCAYTVNYNNGTSASSFDTFIMQNGLVCSVDL